MFVKEYLVDLNATQAAIRAGYSEHTAKDIGCENLAKPNIQQAIQESMDKRAQKVDISAENVLQSILDIRDTCTSKIGITSKVTGEQLGETMIDVSGALKANELLGKHLMLFTDKVIQANLNHDMTEEEADEVLKRFGVDGEKL